MRINNSPECAKSELDIFTVPPTQTSIEEAHWDTIVPHPNFDQSTVVRFDVTGTNSHYIDLSATELHAKIKIYNAEKKSVYNKNVIVVNNLLHSMFEQAQVYLNNVPVENTNKAYGYRSYLENLLCYGRGAKDTFLRGDLWCKDTAGHMDTFTNNGNNAGAVSRYNIFKNTKGAGNNIENELALDIPLMGKIHCDIFNINRYLLNNVDVKLVLTKADKKFYLKGADSNDFTFKIIDIYLKIRRVVVSPSIMLAHAMALEKATAKYPIKRVLVKPFVIPYNSSAFTLSGIHFGVMPTRVVFGIVDTDNYNGATDKNPFNFINCKIEQICLKISSKALPYSTPLKMNFEKNDYLEAYMSLFKNIREADNDISYDEYKNGYTLFAFDLTPDLCSAEHYSLLKDGSLDLDVVLAAEGKSRTMIFYLEFDNIIEITKERQVLVDYKL